MEISGNHIYRQGKLYETMVPVLTQVNKEILVEKYEAEMFYVFLSNCKIIGDVVLTGMITEKCLLGQRK